MPHQRVATLTLAAGALLLAATLAACGGGDSKPASSATSAPTDAGGGETAGESSVELTLETTSAQAAEGATGSAQILALGAVEPGLGAWTLEVAYDPDVIAVTGCTVPAGAGLSFCNPNDSDRAVRLAGASVPGLTGDIVLLDMTFTCKAAGETVLELSAETLADGTIATPLNITPTIENGTVRCG